MLSVLIVVHEFGHFIVARLNGVQVEEFSLGMGPLLYKKCAAKSGTQYSLRLFPIGGYCLLYTSKMAFVISEDCLACGSCMAECPNGAISEGDIYKIDPEKCVDCGACADVCPTGCISEE